jgi:hypothetical protein
MRGATHDFMDNSIPLDNVSFCRCLTIKKKRD